MVWRYDEGSVPKKFRLVTTWMGRWTNVRQKKKGWEKAKKGKESDLWKDLIVDGVNDGPERVEVYVSWNPKKLIKRAQGVFPLGKKESE